MKSRNNVKIFDQKFHFLETTLNSEEYSPKKKI